MGAKKVPGGLLSRLKERRVRSAVVGLGYVGLPLAMELCAVGIPVVGIDVDERKVKALNAGKSHVGDVPSAALKKAVAAKLFRATTDFSEAAKCDTVDICVPTPLNKTKEPDLSFVVAAGEAIAPHVHRDMLVILESTTYPGTTEEVLVPLLAKKGLVVGKDVFVAFSPERVDPGNPTFGTRNIPKVVGGVTPACTEAATIFFSSFLEKVHPVSRAAVAEMVKLLENTFRSVNIGMVNEMALMCRRMGIDVWEVIDGAKTKPFGFMPFYPGPGIGGHCIPLDPFYLSWKAKEYGFESRFIELAGAVNRQMPHYVVDRVADALNDHGKAVRGSKVLVLGVAYKKDIDDVRESPALEILDMLREKGAKLSYSDPHVAVLSDNGVTMRSVAFTAEAVSAADCVVIVTDHKAFDYAMVAKRAKAVVDTRNALKGHPGKNVTKI
jgi:UDP-N-acetyl-D-glucosamine dehydrogenase